MIKYGIPGRENSYNVVSQTIEDNLGLLKERTVFGKLRTYRHHFKSEITAELDYINGTDLATLQKNIFNGVTPERIFLPHPSDYSVLNVTNSPETKIYKAYADAIDAPYPDITHRTELSGTEYAKITAMDTNYLTISATPMKYSQLQFDFDLTYFTTHYSKDLIKRLLFFMFGCYADPFKISFWNWRNSTWIEAVNSSTENIDPSISLNLLAAPPLDSNFKNFDDLVNSSKKCIVKLSNLDLNKSITTDYAALYINGFNVILDSPQNDFNFRGRFDGEGYRGTLKLLEV
jgi:hypothetical protein